MSFTSGQGTLNNSVQMKTNHKNSTVFRYVSSPISAQVTFGFVAQVMPPPPALRILRKAETFVTI